MADPTTEAWRQFGDIARGGTTPAPELPPTPPPAPAPRVPLRHRGHVLAFLAAALLGAAVFGRRRV